MRTHIDEQQPPLLDGSLLDDPIQQFDQWWQDAGRRHVPDREAMALSTADADGTVSSRMVLLRGHGGNGFVFYGNYASRKARAMAGHDRVALLLFWPSVYRQIRIEGRVEKLSAAESLAYFRARPRGSQIGAWASRQSELLASRDKLHDRVRQLTERFAGGPVPDPDFWGGWRVTPTAMEFWQGQPSRLHDRFRYERTGGDRWRLMRLAP